MPLFCYEEMLYFKKNPQNETWPPAPCHPYPGEPLVVMPFPHPMKSNDRGAACEIMKTKKSDSLQKLSLNKTD